MLLDAIKRGLTEERHSCYWYSSIFIAGFVNAASFFACATFATHLTGFATQIGISVVENDWAKCLEAGSIPVWFVLGSFASGFFESNSNERQKEIRYGVAMGLVGVCLLIAAVGGHHDFFSWISGVAPNEGIFLCVAVLAFASGLQNGALTHFSKGRVRCTHVTGLVTDIGLGTARVFLSSDEAENTHSDEEMKQLKVRVAYFLTFLVGSAVGALLHFEMGFLSFVFPSVFSFLLMIFAQQEYNLRRFAKTHVT
jgi:uncharacterized membrane protein YoaK (UPF0700 family)